MQFERIEVTNVRVLTSIRLHAEPGMNLVYGANGSGKSSLLEAINLLSRARSFRTRRLKDVITRGSDYLQVAATVLTDDQRRIASGIERSHSETRIKYNGDVVRLMSDQVRNIPVLLLTPESQGLLTDTPKERRRWLDWLMFHVEPDYLSTWSQYQKAMRHRNLLLRTSASPVEVVGWERSMSVLAEDMVTSSRSTLEKLQQQFVNEMQAVMPGAVKIQYEGGWDEALPLDEALAQSREADMRCGFTRRGPHRADTLFYYDGHFAGSVLSRGQAKLYMIALLLAQSCVVQQCTGTRPVILIDDVFAELDNDARERMANRLAEMEAQSFITSADSNMQAYCTGLFHVKQGRIEKYTMAEAEE